MVTFDAATYCGDKAGDLVILAFDKGSYVNYIRGHGDTQDYAAVGGNVNGASISTTQQLDQYRANSAYLKYVRDAVKVSTIKTTSSGLIVDSGTGLSGNGSGDIMFRPDPRASHKVIFGATNGIGASGYVGISHMTNVRVTASGGISFDCYFSRFLGATTDINGETSAMEVMMVGFTGNGGPTGFVGPTAPYIFNAPDGKTSESSRIITIKNVNSFRENIKQQIGASADGSTFYAITYGIADQLSAIFFKGNTDLTELSTISNLLRVNNSGSSLDYISHYRLSNVGVSTAGSDLVGITFNAVTGGTGGLSEYDDAVNRLFKSRTDTKTSVSRTKELFDGFGSLREMTSITF